jgi:hypothetical protein
MIGSNDSKAWRPEDDERLRKMEAANKSRFVMAVALRRTRKAVGTRLKVLRRQACLSPGETQTSSHS